MADTPERTTAEVPGAMAPEMGQVPEGGTGSGVVETAPQTESYIEKLEKNNVQVRADDFTQPVVNDQGQQLTTPIPSTVKTITVPANQQQLLDWAKGPPESALTWLSKYWIRKIKQSIKLGWHLIMPPPTVVPVQPVQQSSQQIPSQPLQPSTNQNV
jgi:hypothetical protein